MFTTSLARDAFLSYCKGDHQQCGKLLEQITNQKGGGDVKVTHNVAVNNYFAQGLADPQSLLSQLAVAYDRARDQEKKEKGKRRKEDEEEDASREDDDLYVLRYNEALLCVQLRYYAQARHILEELFENIEPIDDFLAIKICFLLLELCLLQREPEQGVPVLGHLEKPNAFHSLLKQERPGHKNLDTRLDGEDEGEEGDLREEGEAKEEIEVVTAESASDPKPEKREGPLPSLVFGAFLRVHGRAPDSISPAEFRYNCMVYRARIHLALRNMSSAKKDCKKAMDLLDHELQNVPLLWPHRLSNGSDLRDDPVRQMLTSHEKAKVTMLKAYLEYTKHNFKKALRLMSLHRFNFAAGKPEAKQASKGMEEDVEDHIPTDFHPAQDDACAPLFFNNMGCVHFMMHKPNLAAYYFSKALQKFAPQLPPAQRGTAAPADKDTLLSAKAGLWEPGFAASKHWLDRRAEITFNAGLQFLLTGRPSQASKCFEQCVPVFKNWPRLWIRLAECCIEIYRQSHKSETSGSGLQSWNLAKGTGLVPNGGSLCAALGPTAIGSGVSKVACGAQGFGIHRRILFMVDKSSVAGKLGEDFERNERTGPAGAAPAQRDEVTDPLVAAAMCLKNALMVEQTVASADREADARQGTPKPADMAEMEAGLIEDAALLKLAWVSLCQHDHVPALRYAKRILEKNNLLNAAHSDLTSRGPLSDAQLEELKKSWTFQVHNLPHSKDKQASLVKWPSSMGTIASAVAYASEALLRAGRVMEARTLSSSFGEKSLGKGLQLQAGYLADQERSSQPCHTMPNTTVVQEQRPDKKEEGVFEGCPPQACGGGLQPTTPMGGLTPPTYSVSSASHQAKERDAKEGEREKTKDGTYAVVVNFDSTSFPALGDMQCTLLTNLSATLAQDGAFEEAQRACEKALQIQPRALLPLRTMAYLQMRKGQPGEAMKRLKEGQTTFLAPPLEAEVAFTLIETPSPDTRCFVTVYKAEGLRSADWSLFGGKSDPYCVVSLPHKKHSAWKTRVMFKELNPTWDEEEEMIGYEPGDALKLQVLDYDEKDDDDNLGQALLQSADFHPDGFEGEISIGEGSLHVRVDITVPDDDEEVFDPAGHVGPHDREPAPFLLRSMDTGRTHRLVAYTRIGRSRRMLEDKIDLVLDSPGNCDVSRLHAVIKCWRGPDPNAWLARIYDEGAEGGAGMGPGGGHGGGGTTVDGEAVDPMLGTALETGSVLRFGVREMWVFERAPMHLRSQDAEIACNKAAANSQEDPTLIRSLKIPSNAVDSALQRCPDWFSIVRVVLECRLEPDEPACVDCIETQDECGRTVGRHEAYSLTAQLKYDIQRILREVKVGGTVRLRLSNDPKLLAPILEYLDKQRAEMQEIYQSRAQEALD
ncbi:unnamed protein product [Effrenium voratum]|nr:unnamed protein product [Effrenium voratum]